MKTPDEIKNMLNRCPNADCSLCMSSFHCDIEAEALDYIEQLENQIGELAEKVAHFEAAQPKWISVEDDLPEHAIIPCMIYADGYIQIAYWSHDKYGLAWWFFVDGEYETGVTHWMPLPEPPKEDA